MNYFLEGQLYSTKSLLEFGSAEEIQLFNGFYVYNDGEWLASYFKTPLKNYHKYKYRFYFSSENYQHLNLDERGVKKIIRDVIEIELSFYSLFQDISFISWIDTGITQYEGGERGIHQLSYIVDEDFCWDYYKKNNFPDKNYYGYKFRLSNLEVAPVDNSDIKILQGGYYQFQYNLLDNELLTQLHYYNSALFLEKNGFISDAFIYLYKIIEIEEKKIGNTNKISRYELEEKISGFLQANKEEIIDLDNFTRELSALKLNQSSIIKEKIFQKYGLEGNIKDFQKLGRIRGKFSHAGKIAYIDFGEYLKCKKFVFQILVKKGSS